MPGREVYYPYSKAPQAEARDYSARWAGADPLRGLQTHLAMGRPPDEKVVAQVMSSKTSRQEITSYRTR
jgi:hypothetical protein